RARRGGRDQPREAHDLHAGGAHRDARGGRGGRAGRSPHPPRPPPPRLRARGRRRRRGPWCARGVRLPVRVRDGADEQAPLPRRRDRLPDGEPGVPLRELFAAQGARAARPRRGRVRAARGRQAAAREARRRLTMPERRILVAVTGGIAAYKVPELVRALRRAGHAVRCALTPEATRFVAPLLLQTLTGRAVRAQLLDPSEEGEIDHIALAEWAELVVVAPATANSLAKLAHGLADDLPSAIALATRAPILVAPAMNVHMWEHPATRANAAALRARGVHQVGPESGELACGWEGAGRMAEPAGIAAAAGRLLRPGSLAGQVVRVTA